MTCEETTHLLSQFIDDVLPPSLRVTVDEHLDHCPVCRAHVAEYRSVSRSLRQLSRPSGANRPGGIDQCCIDDRSGGPTAIA